METDIQIAQKARLKSIEKIAKKAGIRKNELELFGDFKAKLKPELWKRIKDNPDGKLILVTATSPTPAGEGKTTTSIGLTMALNKLRKKSILALREPSLGPCMGLKGGATGGGHSQVVPMEDINLHFTGDIHAITTANNLLSAMIDNHIYHDNVLSIDPKKIAWRRCLDLNDRALRKVSVDLSRKNNAQSRNDCCNITVASEIMAILCLSENLADLKKRLEKIIVAYDMDGQPVTAKDIKAVGAMTAILKDALKPNLVQTLEHTPAIIHGGPFANIAHGCNSIMATRHGLKLADYLITEAGFGADLGAEKFFNIKCRLARLTPAATVIVTTVRSLKYNGGEKLENLKKENLDALKKGIVNLEKHLENIRKFGVPAVVAVNNFPTDTQKELAFIKDYCNNQKIPLAISRAWEMGGKGALELARIVLETVEKNETKFKPLYPLTKTLREKIETIAKEIYGATAVNFSREAEEQMKRFEKDGFSKLPICMAKTQYSLSDDPKLLGRPRNFTINISELRLSSGAGFIVALSGKIMTMPGLPKLPAAEKIDVDNKGKIVGLF